MDKISVETVCSSYDRTKVLDVDSLINRNTDENKVVFNIDKLINVREDKKKRVLEHHKRLFKICLKRINVYNDKYKTDMVYEIPNTIHTCPEYEPDNCMAYIEDKLRELHMDTYVVTPLTIFVSWVNIEKNRDEDNSI